MPERDERWSTYEPTSDDYEIEEDWRNIMDGDGEMVAEDVVGVHARRIVRAVNNHEALSAACGRLLAAGCGARGRNDDHICFHCRENMEYGGRHAADCPYVAATALVEAIRGDGNPAGGI